MYRTGDLVQQNTDGSLIHLGRIDSQIKIRGQRVETGEIESAIIRLQQEIQMACVDLIRPTDVSGDPMLVAAIDVQAFWCDEQDYENGEPQQTVRKPSDALSTIIKELRAGMLLALPRYMVPKFVPMTSLPLNAAGKLDRRATKTILQSLSREQIGAFDQATESAEDRILTPMEDQLRHIWAEVLGCPPEIGAHANFFQLGGDSVTAMRLVAAAQRIGIRIGVADLIQKPRLSDLAHVAESYSQTRAAEPDPAPFELWNGFTDGPLGTQNKWLSNIAELCDVGPCEIEDVYPTTALQEGLIAVTALQPGAYVAQNVFRIRDLDMTRFKDAWSILIDSLTVLRTRIVYHAAMSSSVQVVVRRSLDWIGANDLQEYLADDKALPFSYGTPLHRLAIVKQPDHTNYFVWTQHHSGYDGYQIALTLHRLTQICQGVVQYDSPPPISRFIKYLQQTNKEQMVTYWRQQLGDVCQTRFPPVPHPVYFPQADSLSRRRVQRSHLYDKAPVAILLRAAWAMTVATYTGNTEATSVIALSGRDIPVVDIGNMVVPTLTTVPVRVRFDDRTQLVSALLASLGRQSEEMRPFLHTGMQHIRTAVPGLGVDFDPGHLFIIQPTIDDKDKDPLLSIGLEELPSSKSDFSGYALAVECTVNSGRAVDVEMRYDSKVLPVPMAEALLSQFDHIIHELEAHSDTAIGDLNLLGPSDAERIRKWNHPVLEATPIQTCIHDLVQTMVDRQPHAPAVLSWDGELLYSELGESACRLAHHLVGLGVGPEVTIGVCMDKSIWAMVSMLAILQAGGVVVALGTQYPQARIDTIIVDASIRVTLLDEKQSGRLSGLPRPIVVDQSFVEQLPSYKTLPRTGVNPEHAAWIIYTSGSTGTPKGVVLEHQALCTGIISHGTIYGNSSKTRALQFASHTFGVAIEDMFTTIIFGGCTCIPSEDQRLDMADLARAMSRMHVNFINITTTVACLLNPHDVPEIDTVVLGGEALTPAVVNLWAKHARLLNSYGQSECCVESVIGLVENEQDAAKIGFPIAGSAAWVVDPSNYNILVPIGVPGQLLFEGPLLARGYLNDAKQDKPSFVSDPDFLAQLGLSRNRGSRMYCTGDLVRQNGDGSLVFLGRLDAQIKVRGQRVESGEIESRIIQLHPKIVHALVDLEYPHDASTSANPVLMAAIELQEDVEGSTNGHDTKHALRPTVRLPTQYLSEMVQNIRTALLRELPPYMVPSYFVPISGHLPVNASGKLDRRATRAILHSLARDQLEAFGRAQGSDRPLSATEEELRAAYAEALGRDSSDIGPDDYFVQLGGDSVTAMHVVAACRRRGMILSIRDLLQKQTIAALSSCVEVMTEENISRDLNAVPEESSAATDIQQWMLNYHVARPDVGMTYFALDAIEPLAGEQMADACTTLLATVETLHTGFVVEDGKWKRVVQSALMRDVQTYITSATINEWTEDFMQQEGFKPIEPGRPLAEIAICTRNQTREHRILFRLSHAIYDGMCISNIWSTLQNIYQTGQSKEVASFSQYVAEVEKRRTPEARRYWANLLKDATMTPIGPTPSQDKDYVWRAGVIGPETVELGRNLPRGATYANVLKAAWALVLAQHAKCHDVVFADLVSGRAGVDPSIANAVGCCSTPIPVRIRLGPSSTYADIVYAVQEQQLDSIPFETFGFSGIAQHCTDWPVGTMATSWINHVPKRIAGELEIGGTKYTISQPKQEEKSWTFSEARISWSQVDNSLEFTLVYAVEKVSEQVAQQLSDGLVSTITRIVTSPQALITENY
jgi:amino acid adenylation domain-containing protein